MSNTRNIDSITTTQGEFHPSVPRSEPLTTKGVRLWPIIEHAPGTKTGNAAHSEFHTQTHPAGTAPRENTFKPNPATTTTTTSGSMNPAAPESFPGTTSADVHTVLGKPVQGQTSRELHGAHVGRRAKESARLGGVGVSGTDHVWACRLDAGDAGDAARDVAPAENLPPTSAEEVASERR